MVKQENVEKWQKVIKHIFRVERLRNIHSSVALYLWGFPGVNLNHHNQSPALLYYTPPEQRYNNNPYKIFDFIPKRHTVAEVCEKIRVVFDLAAFLWRWFFVHKTFTTGATVVGTSIVIARNYYYQDTSQEEDIASFQISEAPGEAPVVHLLQ